MSIDFTSEIRKILEDHKHFSLYDERNLDYLVGMIREALDDVKVNDNQLELWGDYGDGHLFKKDSTARKISEHQTDGIDYDGFEDESTRLSGIKYSEFANLSFGDNEITHDGDGNKLDEYIPKHNRRVKSYGFFKNEYYDD